MAFGYSSVILTTFLLAVIEFHPINGLPLSVNPNVILEMTDTKIAMETAISIDLQKRFRDKEWLLIFSETREPMENRIRRSLSDAIESTSRPENEHLKKTRSRDSYHNRSGWGGGYGRR